jgi:hypothetical protein
MSVSLPNPSARLLRAASAEQADLIRHRDRLGRERTGLLDQLRQLDEAMGAVDRRLEVLAQLVGVPAGDQGAASESTPHVLGASGADRSEDDDDGRSLLRGPAIREAAVRVLIAQPNHIEALHYRRWYELLLDAGYGVSGKDSLAVFLTQLTRSPVVRKGSAPGVYEVDRRAPLRIRQRLERLQAELREVTVTAREPVELGAVRARRHDLDLAITQEERALEEALRVLGSDAPHAASPDAANAG